MAYQALEQRDVILIKHDRATRLTEQKIELQSGKVIATDATLLATGAAPPAWFAKTDLPKDDGGYLRVKPSLKLPDDNDIFAVGDCASIIGFPREKSGVFAVRQGPPLTENMRRRAAGLMTHAYHPQKYFMTILSLANDRAIAARGAFAASGQWAWSLKDWIDRRFIRQFKALPKQSKR